MATTSMIWCILALTLSTWAAPAEDALQVAAAPAQVTAQLQIQPSEVKQPSEPIYVPGDHDQQVQPAIVLPNIALEPGAEQPAGVPGAVEGGAPLEGDLAASPDANPAEGDLETANSFWRGYGGWGGYGGYGGWGGYRPYYGGGWRHHGYGRGYGGWGGYGGYRGGYGYWG